MEEIQEIVIDTQDEKETIVEKKVKANANKKGKIKGLQIDNIVVVYKDEIGRLSKEKLSVTIPAVEKGWLHCMVRKMISVEFNEMNILPQTILTVSLPSKEPTEVGYPADFLSKPIIKLNKREIVAAAIYHNLRTVSSAKGYDEDEMRRSLWHHILNRNTGYWEDPIVKPLTDSCYVPEIK